MAPAVRGLLCVPVSESSPSAAWVLCCAGEYLHNLLWVTSLRCAVWVACVDCTDSAQRDEIWKPAECSCSCKPAQASGEVRSAPWEQLLQSGALGVLMLGSKLILLSGSGT